MAVAESVARYLDVPRRATRAEWNIAPRKLLGYRLAGSTVIRSNNPKGYLMPDVGSFVLASADEGTVRPDATIIAVTDAGIVIRVTAGEEAAERLFPAFLTENLRSVVVSHPAEDHLTGFSDPHGSLWGGPTVADTRQRSSPFILDLLEDAPALANTDAAGVLSPGESVIESTPLRADANVSEITSRIAEMSELTDGELARLFRVARETFQRWRTGELTNPTSANRRRLGLLLRLLDDLDKREVSVPDWLRNVSRVENLTPYELLARGRLDDVENLAADVPSTQRPQAGTAGDGMPVTRARARAGFALRRDEPDEDLVLDEDHEWLDVEAEVVEDDEEAIDDGG